jgi:transcriptional repressor NrdR
MTDYNHLVKASVLTQPVKRDGSRIDFDSKKLRASMMLALRKRPVEEEKLEQVINGLVRQMETMGDGEISTKQIGEMVMETLRRLDHVAYVRYASVYRDFRAGDVRHSLADISKAARLLGYQPEYSVRAGLDKAADWYMDRFLGN